MSRVLITGGASGFGQALAAIYAARGDRVLVTDLAEDIDPAELPPTPASGEVRYRRLDVREVSDWENARDWVEREWGGVDLLVNNAGVAGGGRIESIPIDDWAWIVDTNLMGVVRGCHTFTPVFKAQRSGRVVNVASMAGLVHPAGMSSYNAVKAAVVALSETMLHELAAFDVGVSAVCASFFRTNLDQGFRAADADVERSARRLIGRAKYDAATIAARAVTQIDQGRFLVLTHADGRVLYRVKRITPRLYHRSMKKLGRRLSGSND